MKNLKILMLVLICSIVWLDAFAYINPELERKRNNTTSFRMDCAISRAEADQDINNVRARLQVGGDVWWDSSQGLYVVPNVAEGEDPVSSLYAGAVWLGGFDTAGNLKLAAQTFGRSSGNTDFWPGPLDPDNGTVTQEVCENWDRMFEVLGANITAHLSNFEQEKTRLEESCPTCTEEEIIAQIELEVASIPKDVLSWPARGNEHFFDEVGFELPNTRQGLGAFWDQNGDELYQPENGDYPIIEIRGCPEPQFPDQMFFWIYNDAGGTHTQTNEDAIQMEVQVQAFAYETNDQLNDMTFQRYKLINRAVETIDSTYFAMWVDPDLGCSTDDYIGCDVERSLMYVYNEDPTDGQPGCNCDQGVNSYCTTVPVVGVDYFRGPLAPQLIIIDTINVAPDSVLYDTSYVNTPLGVEPDTIIEIGMTSFIYYNRADAGGPPDGTTDPTNGPEYYNYLTGTWRDGTPVTEGGTGYGDGTVPTNYVFPNVPRDASGWSMQQEAIGFGDRRTVQASGPFRLDPGAVNELIIGVPWVPNEDYTGGPDMSRLFFADDIAQALFDNCFDITDGPDAPDMCVIEMDQELIFTLTNEEEPISNNENELYSEIDLRAPESVDNNEYLFQGYRVFQLSGPSISVSELDDPTKAIEVFQTDIKDGVDDIYNWTSTPNPDPNAGQGESPTNVWNPTLEVEGDNEGIRHTFRLTADQFASDDPRLINHKKYYFMVIAYAYNNYEQFNPTTEVGQQNPYLAGRRNIRVYTAIPRPINDRQLNSIYADGAVVTRLDGGGAGETFLDVDYENTDIDAILNGTFDGEVTYLPGASPIEVKIYDPRNVQDGEYTLYFDQGNDAEGNPEVQNEHRWTLRKEGDPDFEVISDRDISRINEQLMAEYGFSITVGQSDDSGDIADESNGAIGQALEYADPNGTDWYRWIPDDFQIPGFGSGLFNYLPTSNQELYNDLDPNQALSHLGNQAFAPFALTEYRTTETVLTPGLMNSSIASFLAGPLSLSRLNNVDIVFTSDKTKWSRCIVVETASPFYYDSNLSPVMDILGIGTEGNARSLELRGAPSVGKYDNDGDGVADEDGDSMTGMGWFPGYAIDVETGRRLNIFFGENSMYRCDSGLETLCDGSIGDGLGYDDGFATGADMMWNPTAQQLMTTGDNQLDNGSFYSGYIGGQHYIYVTDTDYDECAEIRSAITNPTLIARIPAYQAIKWVGMPILNTGTSMADLGSGETGLIPNDMTVKVRVDNPYVAFDAGADEPEPATGVNNGHPAYRFKLEGKTPEDNTTEAQFDEQMDAINVVPNPYYGFSSYEISQFSNVVKITNLPAKCTVTIYSLDGKFIRQYQRDEVELAKDGLSNAGVLNSQINPAIEWDLENQSGIPVASGVYLIHIDAGELGERVIKWFGVARQFDPSGL